MILIKNLLTDIENIISDPDYFFRKKNFSGSFKYSFLIPVSAFFVIAIFLSNRLFLDPFKGVTSVFSILCAFYMLFQFIVIPMIDNISDKFFGIKDNRAISKFFPYVFTPFIFVYPIIFLFPQKYSHFYFFILILYSFLLFLRTLSFVYRKSIMQCFILLCVSSVFLAFLAVLILFSGTLFFSSLQNIS